MTMAAQSMKKMRENNSEEFFVDMKRVSEFSTYCEKTSYFFKIRKSEVLRAAERNEIRYYITDKIFVAKRNVMVIY